MTPIPAEQEQIRKDRKTLLRGAAALGIAGLGAAALLRKTRGGVVGAAPYIAPVKAVKPAPYVAPVKEVKPVGGAKGAFTNSVRKRGLGKANERIVKAAEIKSTRAYDALKPTTTKKLVRATPKDREKFSKLNANVRAARATPAPVFTPSGQLLKNGLPPVARKGSGLVTAREASMADRGARQAARQELLKFRQTKNLSTMSTPFTRHFKERDGGDTARDIAVGAGAIGSAGAAIHAARKLGKTADAAKQVVPRFTPQEIAKAVGAEVTSKTKKTLKGYFPTFIKGGKKVSALLKKTMFSTPASHLIEFSGLEPVIGVVKKMAKKPMFEIFDRKTGSVVGTAVSRTSAGRVMDRRDNAYGGYRHAVREIAEKKSFSTPASRLIEFGNGEQWQEADNKRYGSALLGAAGMQRGYYRKTADGMPIVEDIPLGHSQVLKSAYNTGKKYQRKASRGVALAKDVVDTVSGKPRAKDAAGRTKKKEWEKTWFKDTAKNAAAGGAIIGGAAYLRKNPQARNKVTGVLRKGSKFVNKYVPDLVRGFEAREFATPASPLFRQAEKLARKTRLGNRLLGPTERQISIQAQREALGKRMKGLEGEKAFRVRQKVVRDAALKKDVVNNARTAQTFAKRDVKSKAAVAAGGAALGAAATKAYADQPEDRKVHQGARLRNTLVGAAAGSFLGGGLAGGKSGYKGARLGAAIGGLAGLLSNPKRRAAIDDLQTASFETPASRLIEFEGMEKRFKKVVTNQETGRTKTVRYGQAGKASDGKDRIRPGTAKGDAYCARSAKIGGDWKSDPNSPNNLSRRKWKCSGSVSRKDLSAPAARLIHFDAVANAAGWDVRDPRGKSARVFAPGSRRRERRPKEWHEKADNERKLWKAGVVAAALGAGVAGVAVGKRFPQNPPNVIKVKFPKRAAASVVG